MAGNYKNPGENIDLTAPTGGVTSGVGVLIGRIFAVALATAAAAASFVGRRIGIWTLAKTSAQAWSIGDKIYWDNTNSRADNLPTAGFRFIGICTTAAANPSSTGYVLLVPGFAGWLAGQAEAAPAPASIATAGAATYTAAQLIGGVIVRDCAGASRNDVLPTAALLVAAIPGVQVGDIVRTKIVNGSDAAEVITISAGSGGAFDANQTAASQVIPQNASKELVVRITNVTAASEAYVAYL